METWGIQPNHSTFHNQTAQLESDNTCYYKLSQGFHRISIMSIDFTDFNSVFWLLPQDPGLAVGKAHYLFHFSLLGGLNFANPLGSFLPISGD